MLETDDLWDLLAAIGEVDDQAVPVVSVTLDGGGVIDVFRAEQVRKQPVAWRIRGFTAADGDPSELHGVLLGTRDGRAMLMTGARPSLDGGNVVVEATADRRPLSDLADIIAQAVRRRFE